MTTTHYHVLCFQDFGGSQEYAAGHDGKLTCAEAIDFALDAVEADRPNREGWNDGDREALEARYQPKYGAAWADLLLSTNVCPGWEAIFLMPCDQAGECDIWHDVADRYQWTPWWTPSKGIPWGAAAGLHRGALPHLRAIPALQGSE